jgi:hypothetical protein
MKKHLINIISGVLVAGTVVYIPMVRGWKIFEKNKNENDDGKAKKADETTKVKTIDLLQAKQENKNILFGSQLFGKQVLFHKISNNSDFEFQNYAFAGNIVNVYLDSAKNLRFDVKLFWSNCDVCLSQLAEMTKKDISKDLIFKGFVRSELLLA